MKIKCVNFVSLGKCEEIDFLNPSSLILIPPAEADTKASSGLGKHQLELAILDAFNEKLNLGPFEPKMNN